MWCDLIVQYHLIVRLPGCLDRGSGPAPVPDLPELVIGAADYRAGHWREKCRGGDNPTQILQPLLDIAPALWAPACRRAGARAVLLTGPLRLRPPQRADRGVASLHPHVSTRRRVVLLADAAAADLEASLSEERQSCFGSSVWPSELGAASKTPRMWRQPS